MYNFLELLRKFLSEVKISLTFHGNLEPFSIKFVFLNYHHLIEAISF